MSDQTQQLSAKFMQPVWQLIAVMVVTVFFGQIAVTWTLHELALFTPRQQVFLDVVLLLAITIPVIYYTTFRKLTQEFVIISEAYNKLRLSSAAFETNEAIMICDARMKIITVNSAFERITGYTAAEVLGKTPKFLQSGHHDADFYAEIKQQLGLVNHWRGEIWDKRKDGSVYPNESTIHLIRNELDEITECVSIFNDISQRKESEQQIHHLAFYDPLTGLPNRRMLHDRLEIALALSERNQDYGALIFLDLDNFKYLNDMQGHDLGDLLLIEVAKRIKFCLRQSDTVARFGGDEFMVLLQGLDNTERQATHKAALTAEKIRTLLANPFQLNTHTHLGSVSIGVTLFSGRSILTEHLIKRTDLAMYESKDSGKNKVKFFDPSSQQTLEARLQLEEELRAGILKNHLTLHFQAQINQEGKCVGSEGLVRWQHPEKGLISPYQFIPLAEESMLIIEIGDWVINEACRQLAIWSEHAYTRDLTLSINISAKQFIQPNFIDNIKNAIHKHNITPALLKLELTESIGLDGLDFVAAKMNILKETIGVSLSLDDFGTGYSSLSYLKTLPFDQLKIDRSFVKDITADESDASMVKTIVNMAHNFGMEVIAEGVETAGQLSFLMTNSCYLYQGFLFSKPLPAIEFEQFIRTSQSHINQPAKLTRVTSVQH